MYIGRKRLVEGDLFNICGRVKEIDPDYFIMFDYKLQRYEVHHRGQRQNTLAIVVPYPVLDGRTLNKVRESRIERIDALIRELEKQDRVKEEAEKKAEDFNNRRRAGLTLIQ